MAEFSVVTSTVTDLVKIPGRVSSAGGRTAPASGAGGWTLAKPGAGVYNITFRQAYPEFLGCQITLEAATSGVYRYQWSAATRTLTVSTFNVDGTTASDRAFAFEATFSDNRAP